MTRACFLTRRSVPRLAAIGLALAVGLAAAPGGAAPAPVPARRPPVAPAAEMPFHETLPVYEAGADPELEKAKAQIENLRQLVYAVLVPVGVLVVLLTAAALLVSGAAVVALLRYDRRARRQPDSAGAQETPAVGADAATAPLLEAMQRTLLLVEESFRLGREAGERAGRVDALRAAERLAELDGRAREALAAVAPRLESGTELQNARLRLWLRELGGELASVAGWLTAHGVPLTPACLLVKGLDRHLGQAPAAALPSLREAAARAVEPELARMARAWVGRELCVLGRFAEATEALAAAREAEPAGSAWHLELGRQSAEARFFAAAEAAAGAAGPDVAATVEALDDELARLRAELPEQSPGHTAVRRRLFATSGDVLAWGARHLSTADGRKALLERAVAYYEWAGESLWALSGRLEAKHALGEAIEPAEHRQVVAETVALLAARLEPGELATLHLTRLLAQDRLGAPAAELDAAYRELRAALRETDRLVTLFSPRERRRVTWEAFEAEGRAVYREIAERAARPARAEAPAAPSAPPESGPARYAKAAPRGPAPHGERPGARRRLSS
jgi:tetratricopeptide (TPR) repeat protein